MTAVMTTLRTAAPTQAGHLLASSATTTTVAAATTAVTATATVPLEDDPTSPFVLSWETAVVAAELLVTLGTALWLLRRQAARRDGSRGHGCSTSRAQARHDGASLLAYPQPWCSLGALLGFRLAALVFYVAVQVYDMYRTRLICLAFYTSWNFIMQGVYFAVAAARTLRARRAAQRDKSGYTALLDRSDEFECDSVLRVESASDGGVCATPTATRVSSSRARKCCGWLSLELVFDVCLAASLLVSFVVWAVLYPYAVKVHTTEKLLNWVSYCQHAVNVAVLQLDFAFSRHAVSRRALPLLVVWACTYTIFTWVLRATVARSAWPYPFLDLATPWAPAWYTGGLVAHVSAFGCVLALSKCKGRSTTASGVA